MNTNFNVGDIVETSDYTMSLVFNPNFISNRHLDPDNATKYSDSLPENLMWGKIIKFIEHPRYDDVVAVEGLISKKYYPIRMCGLRLVGN